MLLGIFVNPVVETVMTWLPLAGWLLLSIGVIAILLGLFADRAKGRPRCRRCGYSMQGSPGLECPECGRVAKDANELLKTRRHVKAAAVGVLLLSTSGMAFYGKHIAGRYLNNRESLAQALVPTTYYILRLPKMSNEDLVILSDRILFSRHYSIFAGGSMELPYWQQWLLAHRCETTYLTPNQSLDRRKQSIAWLVEINDTTGIGRSAFKSAISDPDPEICRQTLGFIAADGSQYKESADAIAAQLSKTEPLAKIPNTSFCAQCALYNIGMDALPTLVQAIQDPNRRRPALQILLALGPDIAPVTNDLVAVLPEGDIPVEKILQRATRYPSILALAVIGEPCFDAVRKETQSDSPARRAAAAEVLRIMAFSPDVANGAAIQYGADFLAIRRHDNDPDVPAWQPQTPSRALQQQAMSALQDMAKREPHRKLRELLETEIEWIRYQNEELFTLLPVKE